MPDGKGHLGGQLRHSARSWQQPAGDGWPNPEPLRSVHNSRHACCCSWSSDARIQHRQAGCQLCSGSLRCGLHGCQLCAALLRSRLGCRILCYQPPAALLPLAACPGLSGCWSAEVPDSRALVIANRAGLHSLSRQGIATAAIMCPSFHHFQCCSSCIWEQHGCMAEQQE